MIIVAILLSGSGGFISNLVPLAIAKGFTAKQGALVLSSIAIGSFSSMGLFAWIGDRSSPHMGLVGCLIGFALCGLCYLRADTYLLLVAGGLLQGLAVGYVQPLWSLLVSRVFGPANVGRVFGLMMLVLTPPALLAHPALGRIYDHTGTYDYGFMIYIGLCLAAILLVPRIRLIAVQPIPRPAMA
jgi:MFS family permease